MNTRSRIIVLSLFAASVGAVCAIVAAPDAGYGRGPARILPLRVEAAGSLDLSCPSSDPGDPTQLRIKVVKWCGLAGPRHQWQVKVQVRIKNIGKRPLNLGLRHIALVMTHFNRAAWTPPRHSAYAATPPYKTTYRGRHVWVVPANPERAFDDLPPRGNRSFATHWNVSFLLPPGKTFHPVDHTRGAAVFYIPRGRSRRELGAVSGIAYVNGPHISVVCPPENWGPKVAAGEF